MLRKCFMAMWLIMLAILVALPQTAAAYGTFNLADEWSNAANPNGRWSYNMSGTPMAFHTLSSDLGQTTWSGYPNSVPQWFKCTSDNPSGYDIKIGDVGMHSHNEPSFTTDVTWAVDSTGLATIAGGTWMIRDMNPARGNDWALYLNGALLTGGTMFSDGPYDRAHPFYFAAGSGGAGAVTNFAVTAGDIIKLAFTEAAGSPYGDYAGVDLSITTSPVPAPPALLLMGSGLLGLLGVGRFRRKMRS